MVNPPPVAADIKSGAKRASQAAEYLGIPERTLWYLASSDPSFPQPIKLSPRVTVFRTQELDKFLDRRAREQRA